MAKILYDALVSKVGTEHGMGFVAFLRYKFDRIFVFYSPEHLGTCMSCAAQIVNILRLSRIQCFGSAYTVCGFGNADQDSDPGFRSKSNIFSEIIH